MEWSKAGDSPAGEKPGAGGRLGSILRNGLWLGRNIAIAGAAITSAPVVIPPLVIISTIGIAFSVPFGVFFAGYACAEKIMSFLLDPMVTPASATDDDEGSEELEEAGEERGVELESSASPERERLAGDEGYLGEHEIVADHASGKDVRVCVASRQEDLLRSPMAGEFPLGAVGIEEQEIFVEQSSVSSEYASAAEDRSLELPDVEGARSLEPLVLKAVSAANAPAMEEVLYNEEKMWEQIAAMRAIVGYTASPHSTFLKELKALYLFTGVEPPITSEESYDLVDINDKLQFLKSVIGVK